MPTASVLHILRTIKDKRSVSRTDLQHLTSLSWGTITNTTRELLNRNLIREEAAHSNRPGRKPVCLTIDTKNHTLIGVDLAPDALRCLAVDLVGEPLWYEELTDALDAPDLLDRLATLLQTALAQPEIACRNCLGIGIALHGDLAPPPANMPARQDTHIRDALHARLNLPVRVDRHPNCLALAERWFGQAGHAENLLCIHLGDDLDMGILIRGDLHRGSQDLAGNFGHMTLNPHGPPCTCGDHGCVQAYCSASAIITHAQSLALKVQTVDDVLQLALKSDPAARETFSRMGAHLGIAVANLIDLFNPDLIVLAGRLTAARDFFLPTLEHELERHAGLRATRQILISELGPRACALGATGMVLEAVFSEQIPDESKAIGA